MPGLDLLIPFFLAASVFAYMPGPAMLYATAQTLAGGARAGWSAALGIHIGGYAHVIAAGCGLAILLELVPALHLGLKLAGAAYLVWLGVKLIRSPAHASTLPSVTRSNFRQSVLVEVLNPKTAIFYLAFLPQFTDPGTAWPVWLQLVILGTIVNVMFSSADVICVLLADQMSRALRNSASAGQWLRRAGGCLLIGLGAHLGLGRS